MSEVSQPRISVECACGARLSIPESSLGRKACCPKCQQIVEFSALRPSASHDAAQPTSDKKIRFKCGCGTTVSAPGSAAGRRAKCKACGAINTIPTPTDAQPDSNELDSLLSNLSVGTTIEVERPSPAPTASAPEATDLYGFKPDPGRITAPKPIYTPREAPPVGPPKTCPSCNKQYPAGSRICVECGIDLKTGRAIQMSDDSTLDSAYEIADRIIQVISWIFFYGVYPFASEAFGTRTPWTVRAIAAVTILVSGWYFVAVTFNSEPSKDHLNLMLWSGSTTAAKAEFLSEFSTDDIQQAKDQGVDLDSLLRQNLGESHEYQLFTHILLHADPLHLAGNLLFLFVLGSRVNALIGNILTAIIYPLLGVLAGICHAASMQNAPLHPSLGASGAIMGLAGMYFVLMPTAKVHMVAWWRWGLAGGFELHMTQWAVRGFWVVLFYIAFDVLYTLIGLEDGVAHWAHLGGFIFGAIVAAFLLFFRLVNARGGDILTVLLGRHAWMLLGKPNRKSLSLP